MSEAVMPSSSNQSRRDEWNPYLIIVPALLVSLGIHFGTLKGLSQTRIAHIEQKPIEIEMIQVEPPKPPEPPPEPEKPPEPPKPKVIPPPVKVAVIKPPEALPPPPTEEAPKEPPKPVPIFTGISMNSTTATGGFAAPVGNTAMGQMPKQAANPNDVQAYRAPKYVPPGGTDTDPQPDGEIKVPYPEEARRAGIEGTIQLRIRVEADGTVSEVKVLKGVGYGLDEAASKALKRFKFKPATKGGEAVGTTIVYSYVFDLD